MARKMLERLRCDADVASTDRARIRLQMSSVLTFTLLIFVPGYFEKNAHLLFSITLPPAPPNFNVAANRSPRRL